MLAMTISKIPIPSLRGGSALGLTPIFQAIDYDDYDVVSALLDALPNLAITALPQPDNSSIFTFPLHFAAEVSARRKADDVIRVPARIFEAARSTIHLKDHRNCTVLHSAVLTSDDRLTRWLISKGAVVDARNAQGCTPLLLSDLSVTLLLYCKMAQINILLIGVV